MHDTVFSNPFFWVLVCSQMIASVSQIILKKSAQKTYPSFIREYLNVLVIAGYGLMVVSMVLGIFCYDSLGYMGVVIMEPLGYITVMLLSRFIFKEKITVNKLVGMGFILVGLGIFYML